MLKKLFTKYLNIFFFTVFLTIICIRCTKVDINGNLDGEWEVMEVYPVPPDVNLDTRLFYNFQLHVCQLTMYGTYFTYASLNYDYPYITLYFPYIEHEWETIVLKQYGINENPVTFEVSFEGERKMILTNENVTIHLRKF